MGERETKLGGRSSSHWKRGEMNHWDRDVLLSASNMRVFSAQHSWQFMVSLEYVRACFIMDQEAEKWVLLDLRFQM